MKLVRKIIIFTGLAVSTGLFARADLLAGGDADCPECATPAEGVYATFRVGCADEIFRALITNPTGIEQALALWNGTSKATIPHGVLICEPVDWNCDWSWHLDPDTVQFAEATIALCNGLPSYVEGNCETFGGRYCPWGAQLVELRDCRDDPTCPMVPR